MKQNSEKRLWALTSDLRNQLAAGEFIAILSQLCVLTALSRKDDEFRELLETASRSGTVLIGELLDAAGAALTRAGVANPQELVDPDSPGWSSLPAIWTLEALKVLIRGNLDPERLAKWLLRRSRDRVRGALSIPEEIPKLLTQLYPQAESVYLPFDESSLLIFEMTESSQVVTLRPRTPGAYTLLTRALFVAGRQATLQKLDPFDNTDVPDASLTIIIPPFGEKIEPMRVLELPKVFQGASRISSEEMAIAGISADAGQHVIALVPSGILFRGGLSRMIREWLVDKLGLISVVEVPPRVLSNTSIACAILSISPVGGSLFDTVRLVSAEEDEFLDEYQSGRFRLSGWKALADATLGPPDDRHEAVSDIDKKILRENDYVLNPARYQTRALDQLLGDGRVVNLGSLCEIIRPMPIKDSDSEDTTVYQEVLMSNFERDGTIQRGSKERFLDSAKQSKVRRQRLRPGDILLGVKGTIGKAAIVTDGVTGNLLAGQTTVILRLQDSDRISDPVYLLRYMTQPAVAEFLQSMAGGSAIRFVRAKDLESLPVPIKSIEEQERVREVHDRIVSTIAESRRLVDEALALNESAFSVSSKES